jgi:hypothetical protein
MSATVDNSEGYWEDVRFVEINDRILTQRGGSWENLPTDNPGWSTDPALVSITTEAQALICSNKGKEPWAWKDPRTSVNLEFWRGLLPGLKVLVCLRPPADVAQSLVNRAHGSLPFSEGIRLWKGYYSALLAADSADLMVTHTAALTRHPAEELKRILGFLELEVTADELKEAIGVIKPGLNRSSRLDSENPAYAIPADVNDLYEKLCSKAGPVFEAVSQETSEDPSATSIEYLKGRLEHFENLLSRKAEELHEVRLQSVELHKAFEARGEEIANLSGNYYDKIIKEREAAEREAQQARVTLMDAVTRFETTIKQQEFRIEHLTELAAELERVRSTKWWRLRGKLLSVVPGKR